MAEPLGRKAVAATRIGVANYMSPEMLSNRAYDEKLISGPLGAPSTKYVLESLYSKE